MIEMREKLVRRVCTAYSLTTEPHATITPVARGVVGHIWRLDLGAERYAVKELHWGADKESVCRESARTQLAAIGRLRPPGWRVSADRLDVEFGDHLVVHGIGALVGLDGAVGLLGG